MFKGANRLLTMRWDDNRLRMGQIIGMQIAEGLAIGCGIRKKEIRHLVRRAVFNNRPFEPRGIRYKEEEFVVVITREDSHLPKGMTGEFHTDHGFIAKQVVAGVERRIFGG